MEEGVRVEIMCQAKGRPQPEVTLIVGDDSVGDIGASCANCKSDFEGFN